MASLPTGTITFLFSDIEGSSRLWEQHPRAMQRALARHDAILSQAIAGQGGSVFKTVGDSYCAVFQRAPDAVAAALDGQRALAAEPWVQSGLPAAEPLRVRMAIHTGVAELRGDDYFGPALSRVARLMDAGHGGQVLLSRTAADLVYDLLPPGAALRDLGEYDLKNLSRPERIFQLCAPGLSAPALPLRATPAGAAAPPAAAPRLLKTKLAIPLARASRLERPRLLRRLADSLRHKLTLLLAPPGFGKTSLLADWLAGIADFRLQIADLRQPNRQSAIDNLQSVKVAWVSLDAGDNDPAHFWAYVAAALDTVEPGVGAAVQALLRSPQLPPDEAILAELINGLAGVADDLVLVLDDYHVITTPSIHSALTFLVDHLPPQIHLVIASRTDPLLPLARWRARAELLELRASDLRLTADEAAAFLRDVMGLNLPADSIAALEARTEGWVAGLQLAALSLQGQDDADQFIRAFAGSHRHIADYLTEEVLQRQPAHLKAFLLQTAILDRMCGPLCDAVLGIEHAELRIEKGADQSGRSQVSMLNAQSADSYSRLLLEELERAHLFVVPLDQERTWYRYHHLFAEVLRYRLQQDQPERVPVLHQRAAAWYERHDLLPEALGHLLAADDAGEATRLIERMGPLRALARGEGLTVQRWLAALPDAAIRARPVLALARARLLQRSSPAAAEEWLQDAVRGLAHSAPAAAGGESAAVIRGEIAALRAHLANTAGDMPRAIAQCRVALEQLPTDDLFARAALHLILGIALRAGGEYDAAVLAFVEASRLGGLSGNMRAALMSRCTQGLIHVSRGQLHSAAALYREAIQLGGGPDGQPLPVAQAAYRLLGDVLREWDDLAAAERLLAEAAALAERHRLAAALPVTYCLLARAQQARGDVAGALASVQRAQAVARERNLVKEHAVLAAKLAEVQLRAGDLPAAARWANSYMPTPARAETNEWPRKTDLLLICARVRLAEGRADQALDLLAPLAQVLDCADHTQTMIEVLVIQALAHTARGDHAQASICVARAVGLAEPGGYIRVFVDAGAPMARLLAERAARGEPDASERPYVARLLAAFPAQEMEIGRPGDQASGRSAAPVSPSLPVAVSLAEPLTERETEVLRLLAAGMSSPEIAQHFVVSINTVKTQVKSIYGKLGVHSRSEALARARELRLLR